MTTERYTFKVQRFDPASDDQAYYQEYTLDVPEGMTVLKALLRIQAEQDGSLGCHSTDGHALAGPTFQRLFGSRRNSEDGTATVADEEYIRNAIINPGEQVLDDQMLGGAIMWVPGGMMYALAAIILLARLLEQEEKAVQGLEDHAASSEHSAP